MPTVEAVITGADGKSTVTLVGGTTFSAVSGEWKTGSIDTELSVWNSVLIRYLDKQKRVG